MGKRSFVEDTADVSMADTTADNTLPKPGTTKEEWAYLCARVNDIAQPLADRKLGKKIYKLIKQAIEDKAAKNMYQGMRDVQKAIRKEEKGFLILAGDVSPIDVYSHMPGVAEELDIPYVYVPSRVHLGLAAGQGRAAIIMYIKPKKAYKELYDEIVDAAGKIVIDAPKVKEH